jgi:hypothetical protein
MVKKCLFVTEPSPMRRGGLVICGINFGVPRNGKPQSEEEFKPSTPFFSHPENRDRFVNRLIKWFQLWGFPLDDLDEAISQTNLFYDSSPSQMERTKEVSENAFYRLQTGLKDLNASGLLLASLEIGNQFRQYLQQDSPENLIQWEEKNNEGRFRLRLTTFCSLHVANTPHPRYPLSDKDVRNQSVNMKYWIEQVLADYWRKQAEQQG